MELITTNASRINAIAKLAAQKNIKPLGWFDFCSWVGDIWFQGNLTWDQKSTVNDWAWEVKNIPGIEMVFGTIKFAYENGELSY